MTSPKTHPSIIEKAKKLFLELESHVIGQSDTKRLLSMAVSVHLEKRLEDKKQSNILIIGPTASGKTEMIKVIAKSLKVPLAMIDCSRLSPTSYRGEQVGSIFKELINQAGGDIEKAERGIVFLDEFDKLSSHGHEDQNHLRKLQSELLTLLEGQPFKLDCPLEPGDIYFNPSSVLFIAAGAFSGLIDSLNKKPNFGLSSSQETHDIPREAALRNSLVEYGIMPELLGRFPLLTTTQALSEAEMVKLLDEKTLFSLTEYYLRIFKKENVRIEFTEGFKLDLSKQAKSLKMGVRGLQGLLETQMLDLLFSVESLRGKTVILTETGPNISGPKNVLNPYSKALAKSSLNKVLSPNGLNVFCSQGEMIHLKAGDVLMNEGEKPESFFILIEGSFRATNTQGLNVIREDPGSIFGELGFLNGKRRTATVKAETNARLLRYSNKKLSLIIEENPDLGLKLLKLFSQIALERSLAA